MIGVFDSGFGGLTILKEFIAGLPQYDYVYLGDSARTPYGNKSQEVIYKYTQEAVDFLFREGCELIVIACNTASAKALRKIQQEWLPKHYPSKRVLGVIIPIAEEVAEMVGKSPKKNRIGIIGTRSTIESKVYNQELNKLFTNFQIYSQACSLLVPLVEEGWVKRRETRMVLRHCLRPLKKERIDILIPACTHYPILLPQIKEIIGKNCLVIDSPKIVAEKLKDYFKRHPEIKTKISQNKKRIFYTTDDAQRFKDFAEKFFEEKIKDVKRVELV